MVTATIDTTTTFRSACGPNLRHLTGCRPVATKIGPNQRARFSRRQGRRRARGSLPATVGGTDALNAPPSGDATIRRRLGVAGVLPPAVPGDHSGGAQHQANERTNCLVRAANEHADHHGSVAWSTCTRAQLCPSGAGRHGAASNRYQPFAAGLGGTVMDQGRSRSARRVFWIVDNGSSHFASAQPRNFGPVTRASSWCIRQCTRAG